MTEKKQDNKKNLDAQSAHETIVEVKEAEYQKLLSDLSEYKDKVVRLYAEFENARKRNDRERAEFAKYANEGIIIELLNILDDLERSVKAENSKHQDSDAFLKGIEMVMAHMHDLLTKNGVKPIRAVGKPFDPHSHEILMQVTSDIHDDGIVVEEFQKGYTLGDKVIRTAKVKVALNATPDQSGPPQEQGTQTDKQDEG